MSGHESWGHEVRSIVTDPASCFYQGLKCGHRSHGLIGKPDRVLVPAEFVCAYRYVTGRSGRASERKAFLCRTHAEEWAARYGIAYTFPPVASRVEKTTELLKDVNRRVYDALSPEEQKIATRNAAKFIIDAERGEREPKEPKP